MHIIKAIVSVFVLVSVVFSQINIRGKVTDSSGVIPLAGAVVMLEKYGYSATTGADGAFSLTGVTINSTINQIQSNKMSAFTGNGVLYLHIQESGPVEVVTYTLQGKAVSKVQKVMDIGTHSIAQPSIGNGVFIYRIKAGRSELVIKSPSLGHVSGGVVSGETGISTTATARRVDRYVPINDVIAATKGGYLNYRVIVANSDTSGIEIKMIVCAGTVTDIDGNVYQTVKIGNQEWTVENLRATKYNDGSAIPIVTDTNAWANLLTPGYCWYNNDSTNKAKYGSLYNWYVVNPANPKKIAPAGWHVPNNAEWDTLQNYLISNGYNWDGTTTDNKIAKSMAAKTDWTPNSSEGKIGCDLTKNNRSGFSALPSGCRTTWGHFGSKSDFGYWWSATEYPASGAWYRYLYCGNGYLYGNWDDLSCGFSVRLLRD